MTLFKDPNSYNYVFYGAIIVLAVIGSLFFGEPASPEVHKCNMKSYRNT